MKNKKYTKEEILQILSEEKEEKGVKNLAVKYDIHYTTIYKWKNKYKKTEKKTRHLKVTFKLNEEEKKLLLSKCKKLGYEKDVSYYIRKVLFSKHISADNRQGTVKELYQARAEVNKIGSNINQVAHYTNFLANQGVIDDKYLKEFLKAIEDVSFTLVEQKKIIDKTLIKI